MAEIKLSDLRKSYGRTEVLHGIDLEVADGEFIVIVGPSGCGKSTLLRMVAGLETVTAGSIEIAGRAVNDVEPKDRDIAMVFQTYALYPHMSVFGNMAYGLKIAGLSKSEIDERVQKAARMLELSELLERKPRQLSGGQRQRVAMGRAIVRDPSAFLFDEPLSNLDAKLRVQMRLEIKQLQRSLGTTSLYVTHDQVEAMTLADRLVVMNAGVAEQIDTPISVYEHPASTFVAGFIGSPAMNFLNATVGSNGASLDLTEGGSIALEAAELAKNGGRDVVAGIRPEHVETASSEKAQLTLHVTAVETLGADTLAHGGVNGPGTGFTVRLAGTAKVQEGDAVPLAIAPGALHLFERDSGRRIADV